MQLTETALEAIKLHSPEIKSRLAIALGCSEGSINRYIRENDDCLTKAAAILVIWTTTGLPFKKILENKPEKTK